MSEYIVNFSGEQFNGEYLSMDVEFDVLPTEAELKRYATHTLGLKADDNLTIMVYQQSHECEIIHL